MTLIRVWYEVMIASTKAIKWRVKIANFPGCPMVRAPCFHYRGDWFDPW